MESIKETIIYNLQEEGDRKIFQDKYGKIGYHTGIVHIGVNGGIYLGTSTDICFPFDTRYPSEI